MTADRRRGWATSLAVGVAISLLFLWLTLRRVDFGAVGQAMATVSLPVLSLALLTRGAAFLALGLRSRFTIAPAGAVSFPYLALAHLLGYTGNNVLPFRLGELLRIDYLFRRTGVRRSFLLGTVAAERLMDSVALLALFALTVPVVLGRDTLAGSFPALAVATALATGVAVALSRWSALPRLVERGLRPLHPGMAAAFGDRVGRAASGLTALADLRWTPAAAAATALYWLTAAGSVRVVIAAFGLTLPWYAPFMIVALTALGTALPSSPGFVGTYHYFSAMAVALLGADPATAASFAIVAHAMAVVPYTLLGLAVFARSIRVWAVEAQQAPAGGGPGTTGPQDGD